MFQIIQTDLNFKWKSQTEIEKKENKKKREWVSGPKPTEAAHLPSPK
jgi:hypothetical protein